MVLDSATEENGGRGSHALLSLAPKALCSAKLNGCVPILNGPIAISQFSHGELVESSDAGPGKQPGKIAAKWWPWQQPSEKHKSERGCTLVL